MCQNITIEDNETTKYNPKKKDLFTSVTVLMLTLKLDLSPDPGHRKISAVHKLHGQVKKCCLIYSVKTLSLVLRLAH